LTRVRGGNILYSRSKGEGGKIKNKETKNPLLKTTRNNLKKRPQTLQCKKKKKRAKKIEVAKSTGVQNRRKNNTQIKLIGGGAKINNTH